MTPRRYRLGKRADQAARTRQRILDAAMDMFQRQRIHNTSIQQVARRADVSPATILNHFESRDGLVEAVVDHITQSLNVPTEAIFERQKTRTARLRTLARELARFYERSEAWYDVYRRERDDVPAFQRAERGFYESVTRLFRQALGDGTQNRTLTAAMAIISPAVLGQLRASDLATDDAADLATEILTAWLDARQNKP